MLERLTAAYNFVPLNHQVVCPDWQHLVSHDVPMRDGLSASLTIEVTAHTPLLVGRDRKSGGDGIGKVEFFRHPDGTPAIPGSSLRGMIRNVLEIATFGRMRLMDDRALSIRDLDLERYRTLMTKNIGQRHAPCYESRVRGGWLNFDPTSGKWQLKESEIWRIEQSEFDRLPSTVVPGSTVYKALVGAITGATKDDARLAETKLAQLKGRTERWFVTHDTSARDKRPRVDDHAHSGGKRLRYTKVIFDKSTTPGVVPGIVVATGQPGKMYTNPRQVGGAGLKHMEFVFSATTGTSHVIPHKVMQEFREVYAKSSTLRFLESSQSPYKMGIPVFFLADAAGAVQRIGLSQMFRVAGAKTTAEMARTQQRDVSGQDFVETLFGHLEPDSSGLRSRVSFYDARWSSCLDSKTYRFLQPEIVAVLGSPKPSFYPSYFEQPAQNGQLKVVRKDGRDSAAPYSSILDADARIRGWKRYPVRKVTEIRPPEVRQVANEQKSRLSPLDAGNSFEGDIQIHNVRDVELGAILWALTWGGSTRHRHNLGMGKALGLGQVSVRIRHMTVRPNRTGQREPTQEELIDKFVRFMGGAVSGWANSPEMTQLLMMADPTVPQARESVLRPLRLGIGNDATNEFRDAKKQKLVLPRYSEIKP